LEKSLQSGGDIVLEQRTEQARCILEDESGAVIISQGVKKKCEISHS